MTEKQYPDLTQIIRDVGGIVHSDGNIFFKSADAFMADADRARACSQQLSPRDPLTEEQIAHLNTVRIFSRVDPDVFRWIVYRVEYEHRISDRMRLESSGIKRLSDEVSTKGKP